MFETQKEAIHNIIPVILAGGTGTRLWPLSRPDLPKQFQTVIGQKTLFQQTVQRLENMGLSANPIIMTNQEHLHLVQNQLDAIGINDADIICEPCCRDTAPAIVSAALVAFKRNPDSKILTFPSDHRIKNTDNITNALQGIITERPALVAFGIEPDRPATGYGYINYINITDSPLKKIAAFVEKPSLEKAKSFIKQGTYLWNSGMYLFPTALMIDQMNVLEPELVHYCKASHFHGTQQKNALFLNNKDFQKTPKISIDYALMEKAKNAKMLKIEPQWDDVGSWASVWSCSDQDHRGNVKLGNVVCSNSNNSYIRSEGQLTAVMGLDNVIVVTMGDAVLVADKSEAQNLKQLIRKMEQKNCKELVAHAAVERPWGNYKTVEGGDKFQVKRIQVNPGQTLSLQYHHHRSEHWTIVSGKAEVTVDDEISILKENDSVFIPLKATHRISNPYSEPVEFIEVQCGSYLGEDDIVRLDDIYGRVAE